jgi:hypothetical protein
LHNEDAAAADINLIYDESAWSNKDKGDAPAHIDDASETTA